MTLTDAAVIGRAMEYTHDAPCPMSGTPHTHAVQIVPRGTKPKCRTCGKATYRPEAVMARRQARRCTGCHRVCGNCVCEVWM